MARDRKGNLRGRARGPVSRVLSPAGIRGVAVISLGRRLPAASSGLPAGIGRGAAPAPSRAPRPLLGLAPGGGCHAPERCRPAGGLLPHLFTLASMAPGKTPGGSAVCFLWPCPRVAPSGCYPAPCPAGARTFLRPGFPDPRPPGLLAQPISILPEFPAVALWPAGGP